MYYRTILLALPIFIGTGSASSIWFGPNVIAPDLDKRFTDKKINIRCSEDEVMNVSNLGLSEIPKEILKSKFIESVIMDNNKIRVVNSDEFDGAPNLKCLSISNNSIPLEGLKLRHAGLQMLILDYQTLSELEMNNIISNDFFSQNPLEARFPNVEVLSWRGVNYNLLEGFATSFPKVTTLDLADSGLKCMNKNISMYAPNLKSIHLERNSIREIALEQFGGIHELYLDENPLERFDVSESHNLTTLSLSGCFKDTSFYIHLWPLQSLDLSNNQFNQIINNMFDGVPNLKDLNLSHNRLIQFPDLRNLMLLRTLSLSYNLITEITDIYASSSLETLNLRGNGITSIGELTFSKFTNLVELDLSKNKLHSLPEDWSIRMSISLRSLNLSSNKFTDIENMKVLRLKNLLLLYVKNNNFSMISLNSLQYHVPKKCSVFV